MNPPTDIPSWLEGLGLGELAPVFEENHITPDVLPDLTADDLREMGITSLGHRKKLLAALAGLNTPEATIAPSHRPNRTTGTDPEPTPNRLPNRTRTDSRTERRTRPPRRPQVQAGPALGAVESGRPRRRGSRGARAGAGHAGTGAPTLPVPTGRKSRRKAFSGAFLLASVAVHLLLGVGAVYWVVQKIEAKRKLQFASGPPTANPSKRALEHKVSLQKKKNAGGSPAQARRIAVTGLASKITLPEMPAVPTTSTQLVAGRMAGMGGAGFGSGLGFGNGSGMGVGGAGAGGLGLTMFGARGGAGLTGTFYDLKRDKNGKGNGVRANREFYTKVLKKFTSGATWKMPASVSCYTGKSRLVAKAFIFPAIPDDEAGKAFGEPNAGPGMWIAHYSGSVKSPVSGRYRFVGWGDNLLAVRLGSKTVLDASDVNYLGDKNVSGRRGSVSFPKKGGTPLLNGSWFTLTADSTITIDVILGDEGGIFCAGLLLEKEGDRPGTASTISPTCPIFLAGPLGLQEKRLYDNYVSSKALNGPVFNSVSGGGNPLDVLKQ